MPRDLFTYLLSLERMWAPTQLAHLRAPLPATAIGHIPQRATQSLAFPCPDSPVGRKVLPRPQVLQYLNATFSSGGAFWRTSPTEGPVLHLSGLLFWLLLGGKFQLPCVISKNNQMKRVNLVGNSISHIYYIYEANS